MRDLVPASRLVGEAWNLFMRFAFAVPHTRQCAAGWRQGHGTPSDVLQSHQGWSDVLAAEAVA